MFPTMDYDFPPTILNLQSQRHFGTLARRHTSPRREANACDSFAFVSIHEKHAVSRPRKCSRRPPRDSHAIRSSWATVLTGASCGERRLFRIPRALFFLELTTNSSLLELGVQKHGRWQDPGTTAEEDTPRTPTKFRDMGAAESTARLGLTNRADVDRTSTDELAISWRISLAASLCSHGPSLTSVGHARASLRALYVHEYIVIRHPFEAGTVHVLCPAQQVNIMAWTVGLEPTREVAMGFQSIPFTALPSTP